MTNVGRAVWRLVLRAAGVAAVGLILLSFGPAIWRLFSPFILALLVAIALQKPIHWSESKLKLKHGASVAAWVVLVCVVMVALLYWVVSTVVVQIIQLSGNYQTIITDVINMLRNVTNQLFETLDYISDAAEAWARTTLNDIFAQLGTVASSLFGAVFNVAIGFASSIPYALIYLNFLVLGIYFISSRYASGRDRIYNMMSERTRDRSQMLSGSAGQGVSGYVKVQFLYALLVMLVSVPALSLFGLPYPFLIALLAAVLEFLPIFGNGTLYIPWSIISFIIGNMTIGIEMLALHLTLFIIRRGTEPRLMSNQMGLSPLLSLITMFVGMQLGGVGGLIFAPVIAVVFLGAWQGGLFTGTVFDLKVVFEHVKALLTDPKEDGDKETASGGQRE